MYIYSLFTLKFVYCIVDYYQFYNIVIQCYRWDIQLVQTWTYNFLLEMEIFWIHFVQPKQIICYESRNLDGSS